MQRETRKKLIFCMQNVKVFYNQLYKWYELNRRELPWRETYDAYRIWVSEIILQQTRVEQGLPYYLRFVERFGDVESLACASEDEVLRYWQGLGYYSRARNMYKAAQVIVSEHGGIFPTDFASIRLLPGIGDYTAGAISAFAYDLPYPALDGNVYRVLSRLYDSAVAFDTSSGKKHFHGLAEGLVDCEHARLFNSAIMEFGALWCVPQSPDCEGCALREFCLSRVHGTVGLLPVRKPRTALKERYLNYDIYVCERDGGLWTLIKQRQANDIWKHLWEFVLNESDGGFAEGCADVPTIELTHVLSHQRLQARFKLHKVDALPSIAGTQAVRWEDLDDYAFSRLTLRALERFGMLHRS